MMKNDVTQRYRFSVALTNMVQQMVTPTKVVELKSTASCKRELTQMNVVQQMATPTNIERETTNQVMGNLKQRIDSEL